MFCELIGKKSIQLGSWIKFQHAQGSGATLELYGSISAQPFPLLIIAFVV
jgi:hypothetical protein